MDKTMMATLAVALALGASAGCGKGKGGDPAAQCEAMWNKGIKVLRSPRLENKDGYVAYCKTLPPAFLECRVSGEMTEECGDVIKTHHDALMELSRLLTKND